jgi:amino acid transporter
MQPSERPTPPVEARLTLWDAVSIIVGIVIGVGIYKAPTQVFNSTSGPWEALGVWVLGGLLSFVGALCFAERACAYPRSGGEYVYLSRAYGSWMGLLFAWAQMTVVRTVMAEPITDRAEQAALDKLRKREKRGPRNPRQKSAVGML